MAKGKLLGEYQLDVMNVGAFKVELFTHYNKSGIMRIFVYDSPFGPTKFTLPAVDIRRVTYSYLNHLPTDSEGDFSVEERYVGPYGNIQVIRFFKPPHTPYHRFELWGTQSFCWYYREWVLPDFATFLLNAANQLLE